MPDPQRQESGHDIVERLSISAIEFGNGGEDEGEGDIFEEIQVRARGKEEGIRGGASIGGF